MQKLSVTNGTKIFDRHNSVIDYLDNRLPGNGADFLTGFK